MDPLAHLADAIEVLPSGVQSESASGTNMLESYHSQPRSPIAHSGSNVSPGLMQAVLLDHAWQ